MSGTRSGALAVAWDTPGRVSPAEGTVPAEVRRRLVQDWRGAYGRAEAYLEALGAGAEERGRLAARAVEEAASRAEWSADTDAFKATFAALRRLLLVESPPAPANRVGGDEFLAWRLERALRGGPETGAVVHQGFRSMPPVTRASMTPNRLERRGLRWRIVSARELDAGLRDRRRLLGWPRAAYRRRALLAVLVMIPSFIAGGFMLDVLPYQGRTWLEAAIAVCFGVLFGWISIGFWTAVAGFGLLVRRGDSFSLTARSQPDRGALDPQLRTAILMPICDEPVERVFAGLKAIHESLEHTGALGSFHFFVLSDTSDPSLSVREEEAWFEWCRSVNGFGRIFYRRRRVRIGRKSGNIADFCRRWGRQYRYMVILDADSVMSGEALVSLVRLMERHPDAGVIQTAPAAVNRRSLFARVQQFASRAYGPMLVAGLHYWQLGDGLYWGHNAIVRVAPFMEHCALPRLPGKPPLGGEILSHDFVEAALMGRAGWTLWLAFDLPGSYEETPSSLLEEMKRDRRWCQGNLQHLRLLFTKGFFGAHRALFLNGILSYVSALLWLCFLGVSTAKAILAVLREPEYFPSGPSLFPEWPIWRPDWALALLSVTAAILFLPRILSFLLIVCRRGGARGFGGIRRLGLSLLLETLISGVFAPIRMVFHTRFVLLNLVGRTVSWRSQPREDDETRWREAFAHHGLDTLVATGWGAAVYWLNPEYFWWLLPIVGALVLSVPLSVFASRVRWGDRARSLGLLWIPEESLPPPELRSLAAELEAGQAAVAERPAAERDGFVRAVVDPCANAVHCALLRRPRSLAGSVRAARRSLLERAVGGGPAVLSARQRKTLLLDPEAMAELHESVWCLPEPARAALWGRPGCGRRPSPG